MKNLFKCSSLIRVAVIIVVMAFMATQVTDTEAGKTNNNNKNHHNNGTSGGGSSNNSGGSEEIVDLLKAILSQLEECCPGDGNGGNGGNGDGCGLVACEGGTPDGDRWVISAEGDVVCDLFTGLAWQQMPAPLLTDWQGAVDACDQLGPCWSLPSAEQLGFLVTGILPGSTLLDATNPSPFAGIDPGVGASGAGGYWTTTAPEGFVPEARATWHWVDVGWTANAILMDEADKVRHWCVNADDF